MYERKSVKCIYKNQRIQDFDCGDGDINYLEVGKKYTVIEDENYFCHILWWLQGLPGSFSSCLFEVEYTN